MVLMENGEIYSSGIGLFKSYQTFTKFQINCRFKQIASIYRCLYCLTDNNELYYKSKNTLDLQKIDINCQIKKIYSGLSYFLYFIDENNNIYIVDKSEVQIQEVYNLPYLSIYPGNDFAIFLNSNIKIDDGALEESKEEKRMKLLLLKNDNKFNDIKIMF